MRHQKQRHKLSRDSAHRRALLRNLCREVFEHERIKTSQAKAKAAKPKVEKLITLAKTDTLHARRQALSDELRKAEGKLEARIDAVAAAVAGGWPARLAWRSPVMAGLAGRPLPPRSAARSASRRCSARIASSSSRSTASCVPSGSASRWRRTSSARRRSLPCTGPS